MRRLGSRFRFRVSETFDIFDDIWIHSIAWGLNLKFWKPLTFQQTILWWWFYRATHIRLSNILLQLWKWNALALPLQYKVRKPLYWYFSKLKQRKWKALCWENGGFTYAWNFRGEKGTQKIEYGFNHQIFQAQLFVNI